MRDLSFGRLCFGMSEEPAARREHSTITLGSLASFVYGDQLEKSVLGGLENRPATACPRGQGKVDCSITRYPIKALFSGPFLNFHLLLSPAFLSLEPQSVCSANELLLCQGSVRDCSFPHPPSFVCYSICFQAFRNLLKSLVY